MSLQILKNAYSFAWQELKSRPKSWMMLSLFVMAVAFLNKIVNLTFSNFMVSTQQLKGFLFFAATVFGFVCTYFISYWTVALGSVITANALDAVQKKPLRMLTYIVHNHALVLAPMLAGFLCGFFFVPIIGVLWAFVSFPDMHVALWVAAHIVIIVCLLAYVYHILRYIFVTHVILDKNVGISDALTISWNMTQGFVMYLAFMAVLIVLGAGLYKALPIELFLVVLSVVMFIITPFVLLMLTSMYQQLKDRQ